VNINQGTKFVRKTGCEEKIMEAYVDGRIILESKDNLINKYAKIFNKYVFSITLEKL